MLILFMDNLEHRCIDVFKNKIFSTRKSDSYRRLFNNIAKTGFTLLQFIQSQMQTFLAVFKFCFAKYRFGCFHAGNQYPAGCIVIITYQAVAKRPPYILQLAIAVNRNQLVFHPRGFTSLLNLLNERENNWPYFLPAIGSF